MQTGAKHTHTQTKYTNTVYTHTHKLLSLSGTEDRGIESIHVWRGNRACGDSGVVRASRGSQWCAAKRNSFESRCLGVTQAEEHNIRVFWKGSLIQKVTETFSGWVLQSRTFEWWMFRHWKLVPDLNFGCFCGTGTFLYIQDLCHFTFISHLQWVIRKELLSGLQHKTD